MKGAGYATACVGKWHLGDQPPFMPSRHGFDFYYGFPYSNDMHPSHPMNDRHDFPQLPLIRSGRMPGTRDDGGADKVVIEEIEPDQSRLEIRYMDIACRFIREHSDDRFFLYFPHMYVHRPLFAPDEFLPSPRPDEFNGYSDTSVEDYSAEVACLDWSTGRILDILAECGVAENTLVIFTSDNGSNLMNGGSNAPLRGRKGQYYEGGFRMPCVMRWPAIISPGTASRRLTATFDILPTVEELVGDGEKGRSERTYDGVSLLSVLKSPDTTELDRPAFAYYSGNALSAVRSGTFKLHCETGELYDLEADIGEASDVAAAHPEVVADLESRAQTFRDDLGDGERDGAGVRAPGRVADPRPVVEWARSRPERA
jgi:arylsulfatase A-like enzyme